MFRPLAVSQLYFVYKSTHIRIDLGMVWNLKQELSRKSIFFVSAHAHISKCLTFKKCVLNECSYPERLHCKSSGRG